MERLEKHVNKYERGQIQRIDWLDRLTFKAMERIKEQESCRNGNSYLYLIVDFCSFEHRVVFQVATNCNHQIFIGSNFCYISTKCI